MYSYPHSSASGPSGAPGPDGPQQNGQQGYDHRIPGQGEPLPGPAVPSYAQQPEFALPSRWHYKPRRALWESKALRAGALITLLALCGLIIMAIVRQQTGTEGLLVGLALAVLPVPLLLGAFLWVDRVEPQPWRNLVFAFAWGACAATLIAILANGFATHLLATTFTATPKEANSWGATFAAPFIEETCKGTAVLLLFLFRRRHFQGIVDGVVIAGVTATGFAFTENILYLGSAFGRDQLLDAHGFPSATLATFFMRVIMSPFAHPLFTGMTGVGFGICAASRKGQARRWLAPLGGWLLAMTLHGIWNGSSSLGTFDFLAAYAMIMLPLLVLLVWLAVRSRSNELRTIRTHLPVYAMAGWLSPLEPLALSSMRARRMARSLARRARGAADAKAVREYQGFATALAFLRARAVDGRPDPDFTQREQELLHHMWHRKALSQPVLIQAAHALRPAIPMPWPHQGPYTYPPYGPSPYYAPHPFPGPQQQTPWPGYGQHPGR